MGPRNRSDKNIFMAMPGVAFIMWLALSVLGALVIAGPGDWQANAGLSGDVHEVFLIKLVVSGLVLGGALFHAFFLPALRKNKSWRAPKRVTVRMLIGILVWSAFLAPPVWVASQVAQWDSQDVLRRHAAIRSVDPDADNYLELLNTAIWSEGVLDMPEEMMRRNYFQHAEFGPISHPGWTRDAAKVYHALTTHEIYEAGTMHRLAYMVPELDDVLYTYEQAQSALDGFERNPPASRVSAAEWERLAQLLRTFARDRMTMDMAEYQPAVNEALGHPVNWLHWCPQDREACETLNGAQMAERAEGAILRHYGANVDMVAGGQIDLDAYMENFLGVREGQLDRALSLGMLVSQMRTPHHQENLAPYWVGAQFTRTPYVATGYATGEWHPQLLQQAQERAYMDWGFGAPPWTTSIAQAPVLGLANLALFVTLGVVMAIGVAGVAFGQIRLWGYPAVLNAPVSLALGVATSATLLALTGQLGLWWTFFRAFTGLGI